MQKNKKILVLGGAGFIGFYLCKDLSRQNKIYIIDDLQKHKKKIDKHFKKLISQKNIKFIEKDISEVKPGQLPKDFDYIFDFAATLGVEKVIKSSFFTLSNNLKLTFKAIEIAKNQKNLKKIFFASSSEIYDGGGKIYKQKYPSKEFYPITVTDLNHKRTVYVISKLTAEIMYINSGLPYVIGRLHNVYGPRMGFKHVIPELIRKFLSKNKIVEVFSPTHSRTFCYYSDAIKIIKTITFDSKIKRDTYNIGNPSGEIKIKNLVKKISQLINVKKKIKFIKDTHNSPKRRLPDMEKTKKHFNKLNFKNLDFGINKIYLEQKIK